MQAEIPHTNTIIELSSYVYGTSGLPKGTSASRGEAWMLKLVDDGTLSDEDIDMDMYGLDLRR